MRHGIIAATLLVAGLGCDDHTEGAAAATLEETVEETEAAPAEPREASGAREELTVDTERSTFGFVGAKVTDSHEGTFADWSGTVQLDPAAVENSAVRIAVRTGSVQIEPPRLRNHLLGEDFFDVEQFPEARFESTRIVPAPEGTEDATHLISGRLTLHGQTRTITFPATVEVSDGELRARARFTIDRQHFGITYPGMPDDLIEDEVVIHFDVRAPRGA
jgi:polyisoprenoid-binding protein YceI